MNNKHLSQLVGLMYKVDDCPALDEYGSNIFGRPIKGTWKLFRYIAKMSIADIWGWSYEREVATYPKIDVPTFEEFATLMFHEVTHGWCHFHKDNPSLWKYPTDVDEEQVCWAISRLVCGMLNISYDEETAKWCYKFWLLRQADDMEGIRQIADKFHPIIKRKRKSPA